MNKTDNFCSYAVVTIIYEFGKIINMQKKKLLELHENKIMYNVF